MNRAEFKRLVEEGVDLVPEEFLKKLENVAIVIEDEPSDFQKKSAKIGEGKLLLGLYEGIPKTRRRENYGMTLPDKITIFQKSIEFLAVSPEAIRETVKNTIWHEIAHHFGSGEEGARAAARYQEKKTKNKI